ncbi:hypothetical protein [Rhizobium changzhiense]|uniref:Uncharacterized protein n=1 Tax=Rhizobium changzhiense TaxID=2692317 RepID=A0ABR6A650_9HYPH|nr:hypothetical protein [Rhizobium changzhiense]MBA5802123.1 hypothetical protein [Rhizobium changzhiense]NNU47112.1 hypothetical protein [Rhizobium changzhiense]
MEKTVRVWDKEVSVSLHQSSKTVWHATGYYMEKRIDTKGRTWSQALSLWAKAANYRGNG